MAWFGEGFSSLKGQLSNLAKGVLVEEEESDKKAEASSLDSSVPAALSESYTAGTSWTDAEVDTFIGQESPNQENESSKSTVQGPTNKGSVDKDVAAMIPKGIANFFQQITAIPDSKHAKNEKGSQTDSTLMTTNDNVIQRLIDQNTQLNSEVGSLRRTVRELESQVAFSQDENANLSTGLEALDIQHQEAIERIVTVRDESLRQLEQVREELRIKNEEFTKIIDENTLLKKEVEDLNREVLGSESLVQENARLHERITELSRPELAPIEEYSAAEEHVRTLESEVMALRESRDNLERETNCLLLQVRQRDTQLRQLDARVEEVVNEKEIKEREMTQIVFECNALRQELKSATEKIEDLEKVVIPLQDENNRLNIEIDDTKKELFSVKDSLDAAKCEVNSYKDESVTLKSELESLKEELGDGEAKAAHDSRELKEARKIAKEASSEIEVLQNKLLKVEEEFNKYKIKFETERANFETDQRALQEELDILRNISREYDIQKDVFREKELELKQQLVYAETELNNIKIESEEKLKQKTIANEDLLEHNKQYEIKIKILENKLENYSKKDFELERYLNELENLQKEKVKLTTSLDEISQKNQVLQQENTNHEVELSESKAMLDSFKNEINTYKKLIDELKSSLQLSEEELKHSKDQIIVFSNANVKSKVDKTTETEDEDKKQLIIEKEKLSSELEILTKKNDILTEKLNNLSEQNNLLKEEKTSLEIKINSIQQNEAITEEVHKNSEKQIEKYVNEIKTLLVENELAHKKMDEQMENFNVLEKNNATLREELLSTERKLEDFNEQLKPFGGSFEAIHKLSNQAAQLSYQVDQLKDELKEVDEEKDKASKQLSSVSIERNQLIEQVQILRRELDNLVKLKEEVENLKHNLQMKSSEINSFNEETKRLQSALSTQLTNNEILHKEKIDLKKRCDNMYVEMQNKMAYIEEVEKAKNKEIESLKQEVDTLKTQLEFASQLLQNVERQEGEGQPSGESNSQKASLELQEELSRISAELLKEQTDYKLVKNQLEETKEKLEKAESQLKTLKTHLVNVEDSYSTELSAAEEKLRETQALLQTAEERARTSSTAYTSASIRSNQQVEALREQVRLLTEHKEKLEAEVSKADDVIMKQSATVTRLQAVLHQFQRDKQQDIEFETERIRKDLVISKKNSEELTIEIKCLQDQLNEAKKGLAAGQRLSDELFRQEELVAQLKSQVMELTEKLKTKEEKVNDLNSDNKVDRQLVKNLLVGYVTSPADHKPRVLGVLGQVLSLNKEERQKVGLEPGGRQQSLSEAFIKFLQAESQPRHEVILPLSVPSEPATSRKSSLLTQEVPVLPHFPVGRNPGSILKDVLQERRPE